VFAFMSNDSAVARRQLSAILDKIALLSHRRNKALRPDFIQLGGGLGGAGQVWRKG